MAHRQNIFDKITALKHTKTNHQLIVELQAILRELAFHAANSESSILETHEGWRNDCHRDIKDDCDSTRINAKSSQHPR